MRLTDLQQLGEPAAGEELVIANLDSLDAVEELMSDVWAVIHLAAVSVERPWDEIFPANYTTTYNVFEAARRKGVKRVVFASSIHAVGFYRRSKTIAIDAVPRPDGFYGLSKVFGEGLGRLYADKHGLEVVSVRINTFEPEPPDTRSLTTWLSHKDGVQLFEACLEASPLHYEVVYGVSANERRRVDNSKSAIAFDPKDNAQTRVDQGVLAPESGVGRLFHGGPYCAVDFSGGEEGID